MANNDMIWAQLIHLGSNFWSDRDPRPSGWHTEYVDAQPTLRCEKPVWDELIKHFAEVGINTVVIDLGEGVRYDSHPELAIEGTWSKADLAAELAKMRSMGLTPIPKMNFSTAHDAWLGEYGHMIATPTYYRVLADLIAEAIELFDNPTLFHLGMDEENWQNQKHYSLSVIRQYDLWWHDFLYMVEQVEKGGARAWIWSDYVWEHPDMFFERMPKSVLQSNWYYGHEFNNEITGSRTYIDLEKHGFDQVPAGSNWSDPYNFEKTVHFCSEHVAPERLKGFLQTVWKPTVERRRHRHLEAADEVGIARRWFESR